MPSNNQTLIKIENIEKYFPGVHALKNVSFELNSNEVHVLLGENGAGKSTLVKILSGIYKPNSGNIYIEGKITNINCPHDAQKLGISTIHQELMLAANVSVAENIFMGRELIRNRFIRTVDFSAMQQKAHKMLNDTLKANINVKKKVELLSVAERQLVEIARAIMWGAKVIIMDEPTSSLTRKDIDMLFKIINQLKKEGVTILYISHRMEEIFMIGDRVTVLRDGEYIGTRSVKETDLDKLIKMMVGRSLDNKYPKEKIETGEVALRVDNMSKEGAFKNVSFEAHKGELLGIFGLIGSGRTELARAIFGADLIDKGEIELFGKKVRIKKPKDAISLGIGLIPEDRKLDGLIQIMSVVNNITLPLLDKLRGKLFVNYKKQREIANEYVKSIKIITPNIERATRYLSGGNQQKVVIAKWLCVHSNVFIFDEPTRGVDVGAKVEIYKLINQLLKKGACIIMISSEIPELLGMVDRILVMKRGELVKNFDRKDATQEEILKCAL